MPRTSIPLQSVPRYGAEMGDVSWTAGDAANDHSFANNGRVLLLMRNKHTSGQTATVQGVANDRTFNQAPAPTLTPAAGDVDPKTAVAGPFAVDGFNQSDGTVHVDLADDTAVEFAALELTSG